MKILLHARSSSFAPPFAANSSELETPALRSITSDFESASIRLCRQLRTALSLSRERLLARYEEIAPSHRDLIQDALDEAESQAWRTAYPALFFPDLAELHLEAVLPTLPRPEDDPRYI